MCVCVLVGMCADVENCRLDDLSLSQDLIHEHIGMESHCFSDGGAREEEKQFNVCEREREGWFELVLALFFITVRYSGLCDGGSLEQTLQFFALIGHFKVNVRCTM